MRKSDALLRAQLPPVCASTAALDAGPPVAEVFTTVPPEFASFFLSGRQCFLLQSCGTHCIAQHIYSTAEGILHDIAFVFGAPALFRTWH